MQLLYHGTDTGNGIKIARAGTILSPWYKRIQDFKEVYKGREEEFKELFPGKTIEEEALDSACALYGLHEIEYRVKALSVSRFLYGQGVGAEYYGMQWEDYKGGLVLAIEVTTEINRILPSNWEQSPTIIIPEKLEIKSLREVHLSPRCIKDAEQIVKREFKKYNPQYLKLR